MSGLGAVLSLIGIVTGYFGLEASLRHSNLGSAPNWHDPPITASERFWMNFPSRYFFLAGLLLLVIALVRLIVWATIRKWRGHDL